VNDSKTLKILLVEDDLEDEQLLCEALIEIEENRQWCNWRTSSIVHVEQLSDAVDCLSRDSFDVILLNLSLPDSPALLDSFFELKSHVSATPIVVLADQEDENLANRLLREGAQDVVLKPELDCAPLSRSLRYAVERQRRAIGQRTAPFVDDLTGALTRQGFFTIAEYYSRLSRHNRKNLLIASIDVAGTSNMFQGHREARDLIVMRAAEVLRRAFEPPSLLGRVETCRFGLIAVGLTETTLQGLLNRAAADIEDACRSDGRRPATVRYSIAELDSDTDPEDLLGDNTDEFAARARRPMKTVMLTD
jgi:PleD family two-component response regulator